MTSQYHHFHLHFFYGYSICLRRDCFLNCHLYFKLLLIFEFYSYPYRPYPYKTYPCCPVAKSCLTLCNPMDQSKPGLPVCHWSLSKFMFIELVMPSNHLILCCPLLLLPSIFPASGSFPMSRLFASDSQSIEASASVLPVSIQG